MYNKFFSFVLAAVFSICASALSADAQVNSVNDIYYKKAQLQKIYDTDFMSFVNKTEMIGYRLNDFNVDIQYYRNNVKALMEKIDNSLNQIDIIQNSSDLSDTDKSMQISAIYKDIDTFLFDLDSKTINFMTSCRNSMPTITYQRFAKKFQNFYNAFRLSSTNVNVY